MMRWRWLVPRLSYFRHVSYNRTTGSGADCSSPLTSQSKARVSMSGPTLDRDTMLLRGSPPHAGSISEGVGTGSIISFFWGAPRCALNAFCGANSMTIAK